MPNNENKFTSAFVKNLKRRGVYAHKHADKFSSGIPDIYTPGGIWIEGKATPIPRDSVNFLRFFTPLQEMTMNTLLRDGDKVFVSIYVMPRREKPLKFFILMPWSHFKFIERWDQQLLDLFAYAIPGTRNLPLEALFDFTTKPIEFKWDVFTNKWLAFESMHHRYHIRHDRTVQPDAIHEESGYAKTEAVDDDDVS